MIDSRGINLVGLSVLVTLACSSGATQNPELRATLKQLAGPHTGHECTWVMNLHNDTEHPLTIGYLGPALSVESAAGNLVVEDPHYFATGRVNLCRGSHSTVTLASQASVALSLAVPNTSAEIELVESTIWYQVCGGMSGDGSVNRLNTQWRAGTH